jgi:hypothetical protein
MHRAVDVIVLQRGTLYLHHIARDAARGQDSSDFDLYHTVERAFSGVPYFWGSEQVTPLRSNF